MLFDRCYLECGYLQSGSKWLFNLKSAVAATSAAALMFMAGSASAAVITKTFDFTAHSFKAYGAGPALISPVIGSITVVFDDDVSTGDNTSGITVNNLNVAFGSVLAFQYLKYADTMVIGGIDGGISGLTFGSDDFILSIQNASQINHTLAVFSYMQAGEPGFWQTTSFGDLPSAVPEPATWAMMITGFALAGTAIRRRRQTLVAA